MPTRKTVTTVEEQAPEDVELIEVDEVEEAAETALDGLLAEFSGADDVVVNVYRQGEGKNISFLFKTMPEEMNGGDIMERCRDQFGTGDYRLHVRKGARILANRSFSVEAPAKPEAPQHPQQFGIAELMALMTKQNENMQTMFANTLTAIATMTAGATKNQPQINPIEQQNAIIQGIAAMKEIADSGNKGPDGVTMLMKGLELAKDFAPKMGETNVMDLASKFVDAVPMLSQAGKAGQPVMVPRPNPAHPMMPGPNPKQPVVPSGAVKTEQPLPPGEIKPAQNPEPQNVPDPAAEKDKETEAFFMQAKANLQWLCLQAQRNADPGLYAEVVLDQMGHDKVLEFIGHRDALQQLAQVEPTVGLYPGWFEALKNAILEMTSEETESEPEPEGEPIADETPDPATVVARIDESGLRRKDRQGATVLIPQPDTETTVRVDSESPGDT